MHIPNKWKKNLRYHFSDLLVEFTVLITISALSTVPIELYCYADIKLVHRLKMLSRKSMYSSAGRFVSDNKTGNIWNEGRDTAFDLCRRTCCATYIINSFCIIKVQFILLQCRGRPLPGVTIYYNIIESRSNLLVAIDFLLPTIVGTRTLHTGRRMDADYNGRVKSLVRLTLDRYRINR